MRAFTICRSCDQVKCAADVTSTFVISAAVVLCLVATLWGVGNIGGNLCYLGMVVTLICGGVRAQEVKVALVINIPYKYALSLVQNNRNWCIVVSAILVLPCNELQAHLRCRNHPYTNLLMQLLTQSQTCYLRSAALMTMPGQPMHTVCRSQMQ